jgi:hypothetical protein
MMDVALIRKRLKTEIDHARRAAAERRERTKTATRAYETFLEEIAVPSFRQIANVLKAEGIPFEVQTPLGGVRLVSDRNRDDVLALELDTAQDPPQVMLSSMRTWGSRVLQTERALKERTAIEHLSQEDVLDCVVEGLRPWLA